MNKHLAFTALLSLSVAFTQAQSVEEHVIAIGNDPVPVENNHFKQGTNVDPKGVKIDLNNFYLRSAGKPILPVMGEFHYSRYPRAEWEQALLQMKAAGVQIIALYTFWNHHEQEEGKFRFDDNCDVHYFLELCKKHGLQAVVRIGPWAHGEDRNGGYPDWFVKRHLKNGFDRASQNGEIQPEVVTWYAKLGEQFKGLYYKDGGPIIGLQVDNEVHSSGPGSWGYQYLTNLKKLAVDKGMDVPLYVVTGWPGPVVPEDEVLPLWGGYADAPWAQNTKEQPANNLYQFITDRRDKNIGNDVLKYDKGDATVPVYRHPFLTVEMGSGLQDTYLRRVVVDNKDILGMLYTRLGTGANMLGYYVFHGTQHPLSWDGEHSMQESKATIYPYPNDYPLISYDFEAPLGEWGYTQDYYHDLKLLHQFTADYGAKLAPMFSIVPADNPVKADDMDKLRYAVRSKDGAGFVFFNNYVRHYKMADHQQVAFTIKTPKETLRIPQQGGISIKSGAEGLIPFNLNAGDVLIKYATVHPSAIIGDTYFYYTMDGIEPQFKLDNSNIAGISFPNGKVTKQGKFTFLNSIRPGTDCIATITTKNKKTIKLVVFTAADAKYSYVFNIKGTKTLVLTSKQAFYDEVKNELTVRSIDEPEFSVYAYPALQTKNAAAAAKGKDGLFNVYALSIKAATQLKVKFPPVAGQEQLAKYVQSHTETPVRPGYGVHYSDTVQSVTYKLALPAQLPDGVYDELLQLTYTGNTAAIYANKTIIADDYFNGKPMYFSLRRNADKLGKNEFLMQITPVLNKPNIYFEPDVAAGLKASNETKLTNVTAKPVYQVVL